ncbi:MAG: hypothetical protein WBR13_16435 [Allosphingosinicella sp.]
MLLAGLGVGAVGAAAAAAPVFSLRFAGNSSGRRASWWDRTFQSLHSAGLAEWRGVVGETFSLETANGSHLLRIAAVTAFPRSGSRPVGLGRSRAFSVVFESIAGPPMPASDRLYQLVHPSYPPLPIFMGAPSEVDRKTRLTAVFN